MVIEKQGTLRACREGGLGGGALVSVVFASMDPAVRLYDGQQTARRCPRVCGASAPAYMVVGPAPGLWTFTRPASRRPRRSPPPPPPSPPCILPLVGTVDCGPLFVCFGAYGGFERVQKKRGGGSSFYWQVPRLCYRAPNVFLCNLKRAQTPWALASA
jgi:hypothetical protein